MAALARRCAGIGRAGASHANGPPVCRSCLLYRSCATEASNVVLNLCFEEANVDRVSLVARQLLTQWAPALTAACRA